MTTTNHLITDDLSDDSVPLSRKLAINGIEQDLSEDRAWTVAAIYPLSMRIKADDLSEASTVVVTALINVSLVSVFRATSLEIITPSQLTAQGGVLLTDQVSFDNVTGTLVFGTPFTSTSELLNMIINGGSFMPTGNWDDSAAWDDDAIWTDN